MSHFSYEIVAPSFLSRNCCLIFQLNFYHCLIEILVPIFCRNSCYLIFLSKLLSHLSTEFHYLTEILVLFFSLNSRCLIFQSKLLSRFKQNFNDRLTVNSCPIFQSKQLLLLLSVETAVSSCSLKRLISQFQYFNFL